MSIVSRLTATNDKTKAGQSTDLLSINQNQIFNLFQVSADASKVIPGTVISIGISEGKTETILAPGISLDDLTPKDFAYTWKSPSFNGVISGITTFFVRVDSIAPGFKLKKDTIKLTVFTFNS